MQYVFKPFFIYFKRKVFKQIKIWKAKLYSVIYDVQNVQSRDPYLYFTFFFFIPKYM